MSERIHSMDALRALTMVLILPFHALVLVGLRGGTNSFEDGILWAIHVFRLPLFFLVAGFFAALVIDARGLREFLRNRGVRIGIPLLVGVLALVPRITLEVQALAELPHREDAQGLGVFLDFHPSFLWFLWYLVLIYAAVLGGRRALSAASGLGPLLHRAGAWVLSHGLAPLLLALPTALFLYWQPAWIPDAPAESFSPEPDLLAYYALFFLAGWLLFATPGLRDEVERHPGRYLAMAALTLPPGLALYLLQSEPGLGTRPVHLLALFLFAAANWSLVFGLLGVARRYGSKPNARLRYWTDSSYWIYLSHFPVMAAIALLIAGLAMPEALRVVLLIVVTLAVIYPAYGVFVRHTAVGRVLHGPRPRERPTRAGRRLTRREAAAEPRA